MTTEEVIEIVSCILIILIGVFFIGLAIYNIVRDGNKKNWKKTTAKVVGRHHYTTPNPPSKTRARPAYREGFEKEITYTVNGKSYNKYVDDKYDGSFEIYYNVKKPDYFRIADEFVPGKNSKAPMFVATFGIIGLILIFIGILILTG